jgi:hypothetical protein
VPKPPVRALTVGVPEPHPVPGPALSRSASFLHRARAAFAEAGYEVQTLRLSTRPALTDLSDWSPSALARYGEALQGILDDSDVPFCSLGPAMPHIEPQRAEAVADVIAGHEALNCSIMVATVEDGLDVPAAHAAAATMLRLAAGTDQGLGNFNFAALACVGPGTPFFPAAYHSGPASLTVALQGSGIVAEALSGGAGLAEVTERVKARLTEHASPVVALAQRQAATMGLRFGGIDLSPAPDGQDSIGAAMELAGHGPVGSPGTLALAAALTAGIQGTGLPTCGYCGLMLPLMEDAVLARRWEEGRLNLDGLLAYSAVCGTGLDTVPVPGDCSVEVLARVICDVGSLAVRLRKPLSVRLLPVPGKVAGDFTEFSSPYLVNTAIKPLR